MSKNRKIILLSGLIILLLIGIIIIPSDNNKDVLKSKYININPDNETVSLMLETEMGSGEYEQSSSNVWPTSGYVFNEELSKCENGGVLTYNETTKKVTLRNNISDKCYVYFDKPSPDVYIATTYNGASGAPTVIGATAILSCEGSTSTYNQKYNRIEVSSINGKSTKCNLAYTDRTTKTYLNNKIISLAGTTQGEGQVVNEKGYRYEGKNPNNYIWFNNELWRIIGVFDSVSHGVSGQNLVKIIREDSIGGITWTNSNVWNESALYKLLNPISGDSKSGAYYNKQNGTDSGYCYGYSNTMLSYCDYRQKGISDNYRPMIKNVTWYLGGISANTIALGDIYTSERNNLNTTGYIGLMYLSDYGYSVLSNNCSRSTMLSSYWTGDCAGKSWLYGQGNEWTLTRDTNNQYTVFYIKDDGGRVIGTNIGNGKTVRPALYLKDNVYWISGTGTIIDPYIIGM